MARYLLALDVGTSTLHCLLTDREARPLAASQGTVDYFTPDGYSPLAREMDPEVLLDTAGVLIASVAKQQQVSGSDIAAIGITSQRQAVVFLDSEGRELYLSPNLDLRAIFEGAAVDDTLGDEVYRTTGHFPSFMLASARMRWLRDHRPEVLKRVAWLLPLASWLAYRLTGSLSSETSIDTEAGLIDIHTGRRCQGFLEKLDISPSLLPPLVPAGACIGGLAAPLASRWGLKAGMPVTIAGPDTQCGLLGMGVAQPEETGAVLGWSGSLQMVTSEPRLDEKMRTWVGCYPVDSLWIAEANLGDVGNGYHWLKDLLLGSDAPFERAEALAASVPPGSEGVLGLLGPGSCTAPRAGLRSGGLILPVPLAFQEATAGQLLRATLENLAYSMRANLGTLEEVTGADVDTLRIGGGMAASDTFVRLLADILGKPISCSRYVQVSGLGAAMAAAVACGSYAGLQEALSTPNGRLQVHEPDLAASMEYEEHYQRWLDMSRRLADG